MNYLAHIFLSGENEEIIIGNFIGDYVKGQDFKKYSESIRKGIILHRNIDSFTDRNEIILKAKSLLKKKYGKYSGIVVDIFYVYFLTKNWHVFSRLPLDDFIENLKAGSTISHLYQKDFIHFEFPIPDSEEEQTKISDILMKINEKIRSEQSSLEKLIKLKTGLMQDLLTGKVRVAA